MSLVLCVPWDSDFNTCVPDGLAPEASKIGVIDNSIYKYSGGSIRAEDDGGYPWIWQDWNDLSVLPGDVGAVGVWLYHPSIDETDGCWGGLRLFKQGTNNSSLKVLWAFYWNAPNSEYQGHVRLTMHDSSGSSVINQDSYIILVDPTIWIYLEVNWFWNDAGGVTESTLNGEVVYTNTAGNTKTRSGGSDTPDFWINGGADDSLDAWFDDLVIFDQQWHTGSFTPPAVGQCCITCECDDKVYRAVLTLKDTLNETQIKQDLLWP